MAGARASVFTCSRCVEATRLTGHWTSSSASNALSQAFRTPRPVRLKLRLFHTTPLYSKKSPTGTKHEQKPQKNSPESAATKDDPFDYSELETSIAKAHTKLKEDLSKLRGGGKFNPEAVENLRVRLDKTAKNTTRLGDLAQCVPRGRFLAVIAGDKNHIKPISSAILSSDLSLTPQPDAQNPLQLNVPLPPPTAESRQSAVKEAVKLGEAASFAVKNARGAQHKRLQAMQRTKSVRPDDLRKASEKMEKIVANGSSEVKRILDNAKKILESG